MQWRRKIEWEARLGTELVQPKTSRQRIDARIHGKEAAHAALAGGSEPRAPRRIADQLGDLLSKRDRIIGRREQPCHPVLDQLGYSRHVGRNASQPLALSFHQDVWQAIAVAVS